MHEFLKIILHPLYMLTEIWIQIVDGKTWQKYKVWYLVFVPMIVVLMPYFIISTASPA